MKLSDHQAADLAERMFAYHFRFYERHSQAPEQLKIWAERVLHATNLKDIFAGN